MKCSQCGMILNEGVYVCHSCGKDNQEQSTNVLKLDNASAIPKPIPVPTPVDNSNLQPVEPAQVVNNPLPVQPIPVTPVTPPTPSNAIQAFPEAFNGGTQTNENAVVDEPIVAPTPVVQPDPIVQPQVVTPSPMQVQSQVTPPPINYGPVPNNSITQPKKKSNTGLAIITVLLGIIALVIVIMVIMNLMSTGQTA